MDTAEARLNPGPEARGVERLPVAQAGVQRPRPVRPERVGSVDDEPLANDTLALHEVGERVGLGSIGLGRGSDGGRRLESAVLPGEGAPDRPGENPG
jgi:hypothetical protein